MWIEPNPAGADPESAHAGPAGSGTVIDLDRAESMRLLAGMPYGRMVFTRDALPAIRPVRHIVRADRIIVRIRLGFRCTGTVGVPEPVVVAYEADDLDPGGRAGWAVVVTGLAHPITDPELIARYEPALRSWLDRAGDVMVTIEPAIVTGIRLSGPR